MPRDHDWDSQYQETAWVWNDLQSKGIDFRRAYKLDIQFVPDASTADIGSFREALRAAGYDIGVYDVRSTVEARTSAIVLTLASVWEHEKRSTEIALRYGFSPDGWGFFED